jgi:hypothetical protein
MTLDGKLDTSDLELRTQERRDIAHAMTPDDRSASSLPYGEERERHSR